MMKFIRTTMLVALIALTTTTFAATWEFDKSHSMVSFSAKHMMLSTVRGDFTEFDGTVTFDESDPSTFSVEATAQATSIDTRNSKRDDHLRSADFFDAENHPTLTLKSKRIEQLGDGRYKMIADLTMRGVTKEVEFDVTGFSGTMQDPWGNMRTSALATATVNREDWGLMWNTALESGGFVVSKDIGITLDVQLIKKEQS